MIHEDKAPEAECYLDVISVSQSSELLLARCVPDIEPDSAPVGVEHQRMDLVER